MRLVDADDVYEMLNKMGGCGSQPDTWEFGWDKAIDAAIRELGDIPTVVADLSVIEAEPVRYGKWKKIQNFAQCSECMHEVNWGSKDFLSPYCPNCGAKMNGGTENET